VLIVDSADPEFFIAHADVELIAGLPTDDTSLHDELSVFGSLTERFRTLPQATIAVVEGICRGETRGDGAGRRARRAALSLRCRECQQRHGHNES
jgi:enoyl-CoA hydratase/carnithine racemase